MYKGNPNIRKYANFPVGILRSYPDQPKATLIRGLQYSIGFLLQTRSLADALEYLGIPPSWQVKFDADQCRKVYEQHHGGVQAGIEVQMLINLIFDIDHADEYERMKVLTFLASKSIIGSGKRRVGRTNYRCLFSRMCGHSKPFASDQELLENAHPTIARWYTIRKRRRLLEGIFEMGIVHIGGRGVWLGYGIGQKGLDDLVAKVHRIRQGKAENNYQAMIAKAKAKIL